jgi:putative ABC transport system permease protein
MDWRDLGALILANLRRTRGRVCATALGVVVGTAAVVVLVSLGAGLQRQALESLGSGVSEIRITGGLQTSSGSGAPAARSRSAQAPLLAQIEALPGVAWAVGFEPLMASVDMELGQACLPSVRVVGIDQARVDQLGLELAGGSFDLDRGQVVLGARVAQKLNSSPDELVGRLVNLYVARYGEGGVPVEKLLRVEVAGVLAPMGATHDFGVYLSEREALAINGWLTTKRRDPARQGYPEILVKVDDVRHAADVEGQLMALGLNAFSERQQAESVGAYFEQLQVLLGGIAGISLLVAAFSIANTMLTAIAERTPEIGLMKAIGATNRHVMAVFVGEAGAIGLLGGLGGVLLGMAVNGLANLVGGQVDLLQRLYGSATRLQAMTPLWLPGFAVAFAVVVGVVSGIYPARRAARLSPIAALKAR